MADFDDNDTIPNWLPCDANWTGPVIGEPSLFPPSTVVGYVATLIAVIFYGCTFVPLKFVNTGDGFFSQWIMCAGVWQVGLIIQLIRGIAQFYPLVIINGAIWSVGNCCVAAIINLVGLAIGMLLWNCTNIFLGWGSGRFGFFNVCPQVPGNPVMNYIGVAMCLAAAIVYGFVKTETSEIPSWFHKRRNTEDMQLDPKENNGGNVSPTISIDEPTTNRIALNAGQGSVNPCCDPAMSSCEKPPGNYGSTSGTNSSRTPGGEKGSNIFLGNWPDKWRRALGIGLALGSGCCYGVLFIASNYVQNHVIIDGQRASQSGIDYAFTLYSGIFFTSTLIFSGYVIVQKQPFIDRLIIIPGLLCGVLWGIATAAFLVANEILSTAVTFPIIGTVPGIISMIWGIVLFKEIRGIKNFIILGAAFSLTVLGVVLAALSKNM